jgi:SAM-dependent MidA family methyltransferase
VPGLLEAAAVYLVEISPALQERQRQMLASSARDHTNTGTGSELPAINWCETIDKVPDGPAIIIANEFLDALPIRQLVLHKGDWYERVVDVDGNGKLRFAVGARADPADDVLSAPLAPGTILELRQTENDLLAGLADRQAPVVALFIDYGPAEPAYGDTLQAVRRHTFADPLALPGHADLTAHVQFASLARKACRAGLAVNGPITQAQFLGPLGVAERTARLMSTNPIHAAELEAATLRLMSPTGMGEMFKVLAVRSRHLPPPPPFV